MGELKLEVFSPNNTRVAYCETAGANLKIVQFDPRPYGTGTYKIKVSLVENSSNGSINFGVAWR